MTAYGRAPYLPSHELLAESATRTATEPPSYPKISRFLGSLILIGRTLFGVTALLSATPRPAEAAGDDELHGWSGIKDRWRQAGVNIDIGDSEEFWTNPVGGSRSSANYIGATVVDVTLDLARLYHGGADREGQWGELEVSGVDIRGRPFSNVPLYAFNQTSTSEADPNLRLYELAYSYHPSGDAIEVRIGKLDLSRDFMVSDTAQDLLNGSFGWPMMPSNNLYDQGPASPLATPALRLRYDVSDDWTLLIAVGDDNPTGARTFNNPNDPWNQNQDPSGTRFNFGTGTLAMAEAQHSVSIGKLLGSYKAGVIVDSGTFPLQADASTQRRGNWLVYAILDQTLFRDPAVGRLHGFVRWQYTGLADRNEIVSALDAGLSLHRPFGRRHDLVAFGFGYAAPSRFLTTTEPSGRTEARQNEYHLELTYRAQLSSWLSLQPDLQGLIAPSGGVYVSGRRVRDALILGLHAGLSL